MTSSLQAIVEETVDLIGGDAPDVLSADAPVLRTEQSDGESLYLVGLIGGKDVGKSSFVNALVGRAITPETSHGKGTATVIAYVHESGAAHLKPMLEGVAPGRYQIITHRNSALVRQALLDLPDIDSVYDDHIELTRRMLRHLLHPVWLQSIEKYADQNPQKLLARVAEGNDPGNFIFCLNKADQLVGGESAIRELCDDYARRVQKLLKLSAAPPVHAVSVRSPDRFDFPTMRDRLSRQRSESQVSSSIDQASKQQDRTVLSWIDRQDLPRRAGALERLHDETRDLCVARIATPLLEHAIPGMMDDAGYRLALINAATSTRLSRWPIVNVVQGVFSPLASLVRRNAGAASVPAAAGGVDSYRDPGEPTTASRVQSTFAQLRQANPQLATLYDNNRLWESMPAELAANRLTARIAATARAQSHTVVTRFAGGAFWTPFRWLLTIGALLWFPIIQPVLALLLERNWAWATIDAARLVIELLGAAYLLKSFAFLLIYYVALWALLRWDTHRTVSRMIESWKSLECSDASLSPALQTIEWVDDLTGPVTNQHQRLESLVERIEKARRP